MIVDQNSPKSTEKPFNTGMSVANNTKENFYKTMIGT